MIRRSLCVAVLGLALGALGGCGPPLLPTEPTPANATATVVGGPRPTEPGVPPTLLPSNEGLVARVNGEPLEAARWERQVERLRHYLRAEEGLDPDSTEGQQRLSEVQVQALNELLDELLIRQAARASAIAISESQLDEVVARDVEAAGGPTAFEGWLADNAMSQDEYRRATELQLLTSALREQLTADLPATQPQIHLRHILLADAAIAEAVLAQLGDGAEWATLVSDLSIDPGSVAQGGDLGWLPRGLLPAAADEAVWQLGPGERSGVVESPFGFHIFEVVEQDPARALSLEQLQTLQQQAWEQWLDEQRAEAQIEQWLTP